ncbi:MAG: restriction endonuclease subunit S [Deltaproteobacteria bacterium]|jgi:type I restriction enzyme S subunit|nr:restriction endonuclease subunit S [Deltaproteobacteria bacterium]
MNTKQLRQKILDLAIRGKLVPQDPADEPASVLLERITEEKARLVREGKIKADKKAKAFAASSDTSHYGELPQGWAWATLSLLATFSGGKTPSTANTSYWGGDINWVTSKDMKQKYIGGTQVKLSELGAKQTQIFPPNTLLMVVRSGILRHTLPLAILTESATVNQDLKTISFFEGELCQFVYMFFSALNNYILDKYHKDGTTVDSINFEDLKEIEVPIPPLAEQHRIVAAIESAFAVIDEIEQSKGDLAATVSAAKSKILSLAVSGKLVLQDESDEPASVLLDRICAERANLIKAGKIKPGKREKEVSKTRDNSHYAELPELWEVCRLGECWGLLSGRDLAPSEYSDNPIGIPYITGASNFVKGNLVINRWTSVPKVTAVHGDLLITCKGTVGEMLICNQPECHIARQIMAIRNTYDLDIDFLRYTLSFHILKITEAARGIIPGISRDDLLDLALPLPPLAEQSRIVAAIETAFVQLDSITAELM